MRPDTPRTPPPPFCPPPSTLSAQHTRLINSLNIDAYIFIYIYIFFFFFWCNSSVVCDTQFDAWPSCVHRDGESARRRAAHLDNIPPLSPYIPVFISKNNKMINPAGFYARVGVISVPHECVILKDLRVFFFFLMIKHQNMIFFILEISKWIKSDC